MAQGRGALVHMWGCVGSGTDGGQSSSPRDRPRRVHVSSQPLFDVSARGEGVWPRYPRSGDGLANHREARFYVDAGFLSPTSRWQLAIA